MRNILYIILFCIIFVSCKVKEKVVEVPVESVRTEYIHDIKIDSVYVKDSIDRYRSGDTLYIYKNHIKYKYIFRNDTVFKTDTITKVLKIKEMEKVEVNHIKWYQKLLMQLGVILSVICGGYLIFKIKKRSI